MLPQLFILVFIQYAVADTKRPFWTEKSSYMEGDRVYFIGVSTNSPSIEVGRALARKAIEQELSSYLGVMNIKGVTLNTQVTFEEKADHHLNVYRLMWVSVDQIQDFRQRLLDAETQIMADQKRQLELELKKREKLVDAVKKKEQELTEQQDTLEKIQHRIMKVTQSARTSLKCGMTIKEVHAVMGKPVSSDECADVSYFNYGTIWAVFESGILSCVKPVGGGVRCTSCRSNCEKEMSQN